MRFCSSSRSHSHDDNGVVPARHHEKEASQQIVALSSDLISALPCFSCLAKCLRHAPRRAQTCQPPMRQFCQFDLRVLRVGRSSSEGPKIRLGGEVMKEVHSWSVDSKTGAFIKIQKAPYGRLYSLFAIVGVVPFALALRTRMRLRLPLGSYGLCKRRAGSQARSCEFCIEILPRI